jgi:hypothetical protein
VPVPLIGSSPGRALASQAVVLEEDAHGTRVFAPVTNRGEAIGVLELLLGQAPDEQVLAEVAFAAHALGVRRHREPPVHRPLRSGQRSVPL